MADKYYVDDHPSAATVGSRLNGILVKIASGEQLSRMSLEFLATRGFHALHSLATGLIDWAAFQQLAKIESKQRTKVFRQKAEETAVKKAEIAAQQAVALKEHFAAMARDPKISQQREAKKLRNRYRIGYVEPEHYPKVISLLRRISIGQRLRLDEVAWLKTEANYYWTDQLAKEWYTLEADAFSRLWRTGGDPWDAINGSSHWRKAEKPEAALMLTGEALTRTGFSPKIHSALKTTRGGALRDMRRFDEAKAQGLSAHHLTPKDFRPCTLLGAVHIEMGDLIAGHTWYVTAEKLGAKRQAVDQDLRALIARATRSEQDRIRSFLIAKDPERFSWLRTK